MSPLSVLWLTDVAPAVVREHIGEPPEPGPTSWLEGLRDALAVRREVFLTIAVPVPRHMDTFSADGVTYVGLAFPQEAAGRARRLAGRWAGPADEALVSAATELVTKLRPQVLHVHGTEGPLGLVAGALPDQASLISLQGILREYRAAYFRGLSWGDKLRMALRPEVLKGWGPLHDYRLLGARVRREEQVLAHAKNLAGRTDWDQEMAEQLAPGAAYHHCDEVMRAPFYGMHWSAGDEAQPALFTTSGSRPGKGTETLIAALARVTAVRPGVRLRVAGVPPASAMDGILRAHARRAGVAGRIDWLGRLSAEQIAAELAGCALFAYASHVDNSPNSLCEAMLVGTPCVAACVGGVPSLIRDGRDGLLVPDADPAGLAAAILSLLAEPARAGELAAAARETAARRHDPKAVAARMCSIYAEVAGVRREHAGAGEE